MIRFLQNDNRITKAIFVVIIGVVSVGMVVYLIPGLTGQGATAADAYATIYPHWWSLYLGSGDTVSEQKVEMAARQQLQQQRYPDSPMILNLFKDRVGKQMIQAQVLLTEAQKLGIHATDDDVVQYLHNGQAGQVLFPNGKFIGQDAYTNMIATRFNMSVKDFEEDVKHDIIIRRLQALITAGVTVGDKEVQDEYRKENIKIKFDYAVLTGDDLSKTINPSDADLEAFFKKNAARYATAVPEQRSIKYFAFTPNQLPGGVPQPTQQEIQQYYTAHQGEYSTPEQAKSRHILIKVDAGADAKTDAAAKAKAEGILKQLQNGGSWTELAKQNSDDPGSKETGGELGFAQRGRMVPEFDKAIFTQKIGDIQIVKSQFGYHIVQVEERQAAHAQQLNEVLPTIQATLIRQKEAKAEQDYAQALTSDAIKNGLDKAAAAHHLEVVTTPPVNRQGTIAALPDGGQMLNKAFLAKQGDPPQYAATGEGYAIFQVASVSPAHAPNFADWKSHVLDDYRQEQVPALLTAKGNELAAKAKSEGDLAKAAKEMGALFKTSDLVGQSGQVPNVGQLGSAAPQLFDLNPGDLSSPIKTGQSVVVAKIVDKVQPNPAEIASNLDQMREQMLDQRRQEAFSVFLGSVMDQYKKDKLIRMSAKAKTGPQIPDTM
jgi:peptidyl-prolyl cis-trans isomerase D